MTLYEAVEKRDTGGVFKLLGMSRNNIFAFTYESASIVIGLKDRKSLIEVCFAPELITQWEEKENPLFHEKRRWIDR